MANIRVLIVEDNDQIAQLVRLQLERRIPDVNEIRRVEDGESAVEVCRDFTPTVVVMDHGLPGLPAEEAVARIRELHPEAAIVSFSGTGDAAPWADEAIPKDPSGFRRLAHAVQEIASRRGPS